MCVCVCVCVCMCVCVCVSRCDGGVSDGHGRGGRNAGISDTPTDHPIHGNNDTVTANIPPLTDQSLLAQIKHEKHVGSYRLFFASVYLITILQNHIHYVCKKQHSNIQ